MRKLQNELITLVEKREITGKDATLILLSKDGLKPLSSVGFFSSPGLMKTLGRHKIPFSVRGGRVHIGSLAKKRRYDTNNGVNFGFPKCCSALFLQHPHFFFRKPPKTFPALPPYVYHVPCSGRCRETRKLAEKYMRHIERNYPLMASYVGKSLA